LIYDIPNLRHLRAFLAVAHHRRISAASEQVHLSQPAITQAIAKLEERLGVSLFDRRTEGVYTTQVGELFRMRVERMFDHLQNGVREATRLGPKKTTQGFGHFMQLLTSVQLRALSAMMDAGNFSLAARSVGVSQPSIHRAARDLERLSGIELFIKSSEGIELTRSAQALAQRVKLAFSELNQGFTEIEEWLGRDVGLINIGSLPLARTHILPTAINRMNAEKPLVKISVVDGPYDDLLHALRHGELDFMIGALRDPVPINDVVQESLLNAPLAVVARVGHPLTKKTNITRKQLAACSWAVPRLGAPTRTAFEDMFAGAEDKPQNIIESSSLMLIRGLLLDSDRITLISSHQIFHEEKMGLLQQLPVQIPGTQRDIGVTVRDGWQPTATQKSFLEILRDVAAQVSKNK